MAKRMPVRKCAFCAQNLTRVDYKDTKLLTRYINSYAKIEPRKRSGNCARHQRMVATAVKRSRIAALMPFTIR